MKSENLNAVIIGAGWAAEGHAIALRKQGVTIEAICSRNDSKVKKTAKFLKIKRSSTDWKKTITEIKPSIVSLATPAVFRKEAIEVAASNRSNLLVEKPLGIDSDEAFNYYKLVNQAKIKHAYAATHCYDPGVRWINKLLEKNTIGILNDIEITFSLPLFKNTTPWSWFDRLSMGGGLLNNAFTHIIGMLEKILNGKINAITGFTTTDRIKAPVFEDIDDFRSVLSYKSSDGKNLINIEWKTCDADTSFSAVSRFVCGIKNQRNSIPVYIKLNSLANIDSPTNGWYFNGSDATIIARGLFSLNVSLLDKRKKEKVLEIPKELRTGFTNLEEDEQNKWNAFASDFVNDILGKPHNRYLTFEDGYRFQLAIDAIRKNQKLSALRPEEPL